MSSGTFAMQGVRPTMEDEHVSIDCISEDYPEIVKSVDYPHAYYAIYDGHRGSRAAEYVAEHLHNMIIEHPSFISETELSIKESFLKTDEEFLDFASKQEDKWNDGCTAVVVIFLGNKLYVANCGDAEVLLGRKKEGSDEVETVELTHKHKPSDPEEKKRIIGAGGMVLSGRVGGSLAVARAFGDLEFKTPIQDGDVKIGKLVIVDPHISVTDLIPDRDLFLIVGCDGVWERMEHNQSVQFVYKYLADEGPEVTSEMLVNLAFSQRSQDNISCTIISLDWLNANEESADTPDE